MGFLLVTRRTLVDLSDPKRVAVSVFFGLLVPVLMALGWKSPLEGNAFSVQMQTDYVLGNLLTVCFIWVSGFFLAFMVSVNAAGLISRDVSDGTLLLLISKPVSRRAILLGRFVAVAVNAFMIEALVLIVLTLILGLMLPIHDSSFNALLSAVPSIALYSLFVIAVFCSIAFFVSTMVESQIKVTALLTAIVVFVYGFGILGYALGIDDFSYRDNHLYLIDGAHHLANVFVPIEKHISGGQVLPLWMMETMQAFSGVFDGGRSVATLDWQYVVPNYSFWRPASLADDMNPLLSATALLATSATALGFALVRISRRDIG